MTPQSETLASRTGAALQWKAAQLGGVKIVFLLRLAILAHLLDADAFGLLAISLIPVELLLQVTDLGMVPALVHRQTVDDRHLDTAWTVGLSRALLIALVIFLAAPYVAWLAAEPRVTNLIRAVAAVPVLEAAASIRVAELIRRLDFRSLAVLDLSKALTNTVVAVALARPLGVWALVVGGFAGALTFLAVSYIAAPHAPRLKFDSSAAQSLIRFGRWILVTGLLAVAGSAILRLIVSRQLGVAELGIYFLAVRIAFVPAELASEVAGAVAFPVYSRIQSNLERTRRAFRAALTGVSAIVAPACFLLIALAPSISRDVLGPEWVQTAPLIRILALSSLFGLLGEVAIPVFKGLGRPSSVAVLEGVQSLALVVFVWQLTTVHGVLGAALAWLPASAAALAMCIVLLRRALVRPLSGLGPQLLTILIASVLGAVAAWLLDALVDGLAGLLLSAALGALVAFAILWQLDRRLGLDLKLVAVELFPRLGKAFTLRKLDGKEPS